MLKKLFKYLLSILLGLLLILIVLVAYTQTASFRELLRVQSLKYASSYFNGELSIGRIDGNLYNKIHLIDVALHEGDSTVVHIDSLFLKYQVHELATKHFQIDTLFIKSLYCNLWYRDTSKMHLLYVLDKLIPKGQREPSKFPIILDFKKIIVQDVKGQYQFRYGSEPLKIQSLNIDAVGLFKEKHVEVNIEHINFSTSSEELLLDDGQIYFLKKGKYMQVDSLYLRSAQTTLVGDADYQGRDSFNIEVKGKYLNANKIQSLVPQLPIKSIPDLNLKVQVINNEAQVDVQMQNGTKQVGLKGTVYDFNNILAKSATPSEYDAIVYFKNFVPEEWFEIARTSAVLNGKLALDGHDVLDYKKNMKVSGRFTNSSYKKVMADTLYFDGSQINNLIDASVLLANNNSHSKVYLTIKDLYGKPEYSINLMTRNLDIEAIEPSLQNTMVNGNLTISGTHILSSERVFNAKAQLFKSTVYGVETDSIWLYSSLKNVDLNVDTLGIHIDGNDLLSNGSINLQSKVFDLSSSVNSHHLSFLEDLEIPSIEFDEANVNVKVSGQPDSMIYMADVDIAALGYQSMQSNSVKGQFYGLLSHDNITSNGFVGFKYFENSIQDIDTCTIDFGFENGFLKSAMNFSRADTLKGVLVSEINFSDTIDVVLNRANLKLPFANFYLTDTIQKFSYSAKNFSIDNFTIRDSVDKNFLLQTHGQLNTSKNVDFSFNVDNLNLLIIDRLVELNDTLKGVFSMNFNVEGEPDSIVASGGYSIENPFYGEIALPSLSGGLNYKTDTFYLNTWVPSLDSSIYVNANIPLAISADTISGLNIQTTKTFNAELVLDSLQVSNSATEKYEASQAGAYLHGKVMAAGGFSNPVFNGEVSLNSGFIKNNEKGIYYNDIKAHVSFEDNNVLFDTINIKSDKGYFGGRGHLLFDSTIISGKILASDIETDINKFHVVQHKNYDIDISGNPYYSSRMDGNPQFGGRIKVNRSSFYLPGLLQADDSRKMEENTPLLVLAVQENDSMYKVEAVQEAEEVSQLLKQIKGRLTIDIPRSTWLKSNDMNIEIAGDVDVTKTVDYFELFGDVEIIRGNYILYGRKFDIKSGVINFMGGESPDPRLDIRAEYVFRGGDKEKHTLVLSVSDYLSEPDISFTLDDVGISQSDAVSIMVFGKTMDELSYDGQNGIIGSVGSNMLANMVTSSLNSTIGQRLKLDMIEVNATENWHSAAFVVGKYITNDLFVIYQRGFGETEDDEITPETITLEYELNKVLFFRLQSGSSKTSGFDVILKFESSK